MDVKFKFEPDQKVQTPFGDVGIITLCAVDDNRKVVYFVKRTTGSNWFKEAELTADEAL